VSVSAVRPPPSPFPNINTQTITKGTVLHRTHGAGFRSAQFNPCMGQPTRFAPFNDPSGACVPTLYAATSREAAAFESIFHDIEPAAAFKTVRLDVVETRSVSRIAPKRDHGWAGLLAVAIGLAFINAWFLAAFILVPIALLAVRFAEGRINATIRESYELNARVALQIESTTSGDAISLVRQAQATAVEERRFGDLAEKSVEIASHMDVWRAMIVVAYRLCFDLITVLFLAIGLFLASTGRASIASVVSALFFVGLVRQPLGEVVGQRYPLVRAGMGLGRVEEVLASSNTGLTTIAATARPQPVDATKPQLIFASVGYAYPARSDVGVKSLSDVAAANSATSGFLASVSLTKLVEAAPVEEAGDVPWVLDDVSFSVSRGETVAVVGESGSGKSTIITLACGIVRPGRGRVHVGGTNTFDMTEEDVWRSVSLVSQDIYLRDATLRENLNYGREDATDEELEALWVWQGLTTCTIGFRKGSIPMSASAVSGSQAGSASVLRSRGLSCAIVRY
jgi:ABC-type multidrug transport system fused ATPase/permease subunit